MARKGKAITLNLSAKDKAALEEIALELGYLWGNKPNISALAKAIAQGDLHVSKPGVPPEIKDREAFAEDLAVIQIASARLLKNTRNDNVTT